MKTPPTKTVEQILARLDVFIGLYSAEAADHTADALERHLGTDQQTVLYGKAKSASDRASELEQLRDWILDRTTPALTSIGVKA